MEPITFITNRKIEDYLVERKSGTLYDTLYKSLEDLIKVYVEQTINRIINDSFISTASEFGLQRWEAFYPPKPFDMSINDYKNLLYILNKITSEGPTIANITTLIKFFDPSGSFYPVQANNIIYADSIVNRRIDFLTSGTATDVITTNIDWVDSNFNVLHNSHILYYLNNSSYIRYNEATIGGDYTATFSNDGNGKLKITINWASPKNPLVACRILFSDLETDGKMPFSEFYNRDTGEFPTLPVIIYNEDSTLGNASGLLTLNDNFIVYKTSILNVPKISHRVLLKVLLETLLPAHVCFIIYFKSIDSILFKQYSGQTYYTTTKKLFEYYFQSNSGKTYDINITDNPNFVLRDAIRIAENRFLINVFSINTPWNQFVYDYYIDTNKYKQICSVHYGGITFSPLYSDKIIISIIDSSNSSVKSGWVLYDIFTQTFKELKPFTQFKHITPFQMKTSVDNKLVCALNGFASCPSYVAAFDPETGNLLNSYNVGNSVVIQQLAALNSTKFIYFTLTSIKGDGLIHYLDTVNSTDITFNFNPGNLLYGVSSWIIPIRENLIIFISNLNNTIKIYTSKFNNTSLTLQKTILNMNIPNIFISNTNLILVDKNKRIIVIEDFLKLLNAASVTEYTVENSQNLIPLNLSMLGGL